LTNRRKRSLFEQKALDCKKLIDQKHGVITQLSEIFNFDNLEFLQKQKIKVYIKMVFEKEISSYMIKSFELQRKTLKK
jgi:hypothetical protein